MTRLFDTHSVTPVQDLNGPWLFRTDPRETGKEDGWYKGLPGAETVIVPSVWNTQLDLLEYEGAAWYQRRFTTGGGCLRFCFEAVMTEAEVWLDDTFLGYHYGGFCQFDLIAPQVEAGSHLLTVRVNNKADEHGIPQVRADWYHYGGIPRGVRVETLTGICVLGNQLHYSLNDALDTADCHFVLDVFNAEAAECTSRLEIALGGETVYSGSVTLAGGCREKITLPHFTADNIRLWSAEDPQLYEIRIRTESGDLVDKTGFRKVCVEGEKLLLNGKPVELRGVNRHEEHPDWGFAFPAGLMKRDLDIITDLGCNTIRGSHYPNSQIFVDMLDARGIYFWSEIPIWGCGFSREALGDPIVVERGLQMHKEMLWHYFNHPSIILWGLHNEILTDTDEAIALTKTYYDYVKPNGGNRPVTYATYIAEVDRCMEYCDIISINAYYGWYSGDLNTWNEFVESFRKRRENLGFGHKPVIFSEFGGAALYGHHTFDDLRWTEEYQAKLLSYCLELFHADPMVIGFYIWQFSDIRTCQEMGLNRARSYNNKGIVNEYRKPKLAYHKVKQLYHRFREEA